MIYQVFSIKGINGAAEITTYCLDNYPNVDMERKHTMILIFPGGGYNHCSNREAEAIAIKMNSFGFSAAVVRYSVAPEHFPESLVEAAKTVAYFREHAKEYYLDPYKIYTMGFSAGAHLAASLGTFWNKEWLAELLEKDGSEQEKKAVMDPANLHKEITDASRLARMKERICPNRQILCYPVITSGEFAHKGSFLDLTGMKEDEEGAADWYEALSLEKHVTKTIPETFLWHTMTDPDVPVENTFFYSMALKKAGVPCEVHIYAKGGHGLSLGTEETTTKENGRGLEPIVETWPELLKRWIEFAK